MAKCRKYEWFTDILDKLQTKCTEQGVLFKTISPNQTNRNSGVFKCAECGFIPDSDINGAINISLFTLSTSKK